jgi:hypothetical protein
MTRKWRDIRETLLSEAEECIRKSFEEAANLMIKAERQENEVKIATLRMAIDVGLASGIAEPGVFQRLRKRHSLSQRKS